MADIEGNMLPVTMDNNSYINSQSLLSSNNAVNPYLTLTTVYTFHSMLEFNTSNAKWFNSILSQVTDRQYNDPEAQESRHVWDEITNESIEKQKNTLVGRLTEFMRSTNRPVAFSECAEYIQSCYETLRKSDGNKYKGDSSKAIHGALHSTGVFKRTEDDKWELCEAKADEYEEKVRRKFESKSAKKHELQDSNFHRPRKKYTRRSGKREDIVRLLGSISNGYHDGSTTNSVYFRNPFKGCEESEEKIRNRLGEEKFTFLLQVYNYFEDLLNKGMQINTEKVTKTKTSRDLSDLAKQAEGLQHVVEDLKNRVSELEKASDQSGII